MVRRPPVPTLPTRPFESPWEELATVYESLPAADNAARLRWLFRASEVWETGAKDIARAFDALARAFAVARKSPVGTDGVAQGVAAGNDAEVARGCTASRRSIARGIASPSSTRAWRNRRRPPPAPQIC